MEIEITILVRITLRFQKKILTISMKEEPLKSNLGQNISYFLELSLIDKLLNQILIIRNGSLKSKELLPSSRSLLLMMPKNGEIISNKLRDTPNK